MNYSPKISTKQPQDTLDNTLRYLYSSIRCSGCELVAIEFKYNGIVWRADTIKEAIALREELYRSTHFPVDPTEDMEEQDRFWTPDRFMDVITNVGKLQHRLLAAIYEKSGISSGELVEKLGLASEVALAGVISGLSKQLKQMGIEPKQTFQITVKWTGKKKTRYFILDDFFMAAGIDQNWPDAWADQLKGDEA